MIFQHTGTWIFGVSPHTGEPKRMTSRLWHEDWYTRINGEAVRDGNPENDTRENCPKKYSSIHRESDNRVVYAQGQRLAVQPGRAQKGIGHIQIAMLYRYDVRTITPYELNLEGFRGWSDYLILWVQMHDKPAYRFLKLDSINPSDEMFESVVGENNDPLRQYLSSRPTEFYRAAGIRFDPAEREA